MSGIIFNKLKFIKEMKRLLINFIFFIIFAFLSGLLSAQTAPDITWEQTYVGGSWEWAWQTEQTTDGGYITVADTKSYGNGVWDIWLIKTDKNGDALWTKTFGGQYEERGQSVQQTSDGGYIILGTTETYADEGYDIWLIKTDENGNEIWSKNFNGDLWDWGYYVRQTNDGGYIITGCTGDINIDWNVWLIKTDSNGNLTWSKDYGETNGPFDVAHSVEQTQDGGYILTGYTYSHGAGSSDVWLIKTNNLGDTTWTKTYGGTLADLGYSVKQTIDNGYIIAGYTKSYGAGDYDAYLIKTDADGKIIWDKPVGGPEDDRIYSVQQTIDNGFIFAGYTDSFGAGDYDMYLIKTANNGDTLWTKTIGNDKLNRARSVVQTSDGGYALAGDKYDGLDDGEYNVYFVKINPEQGSVIDEKIQTDYSVYCYPNPTNGIFSIRNDKKSERPLNIEITNINGQIVKQLTINNEQFTIDLSMHTKGVYFIKIQIDDLFYTEKIVLIK